MVLADLLAHPAMAQDAAVPLAYLRRIDSIRAAKARSRDFYRRRPHLEARRHSPRLRARKKSAHCRIAGGVGYPRVPRDLARAPVPQRQPGTHLQGMRRFPCENPGTRPLKRLHRRHPARASYRLPIPHEPSTMYVGVEEGGSAPARVLMVRTSRQSTTVSTRTSIVSRWTRGVAPSPRHHRERAFTCPSTPASRDTVMRGLDPH